MQNQAGWATRIGAAVGGLIVLAVGLVILVGGGSKKRQSKDIATAQERWANYKLRKKRGEKD